MSRQKPNPRRATHPGGATRTSNQKNLPRHPSAPSHRETERTNTRNGEIGTREGREGRRDAIPCSSGEGPARRVRGGDGREGFAGAAARRRRRLSRSGAGGNPRKRPRTEEAAAANAVVFTQGEARGLKGCKGVLHPALVGRVFFYFPPHVAGFTTAASLTRGIHWSGEQQGKWGLRQIFL